MPAIGTRTAKARSAKHARREQRGCRDRREIGRMRKEPRGDVEPDEYGDDGQVCPQTRARARKVFGKVESIGLISPVLW